MRLELIAWYGGPRKIVDWDPDTGEITGPAADEVLSLIDEAVREGGVVGEPHPTFFEVKDPKRDASELAVVLGTRWKVPRQLEGDYPRLEDDVPPGAVA